MNTCFTCPTTGEFYLNGAKFLNNDTVTVMPQQINVHTWISNLNIRLDSVNSIECRGANTEYVLNLFIRCKRKFSLIHRVY